ncbi:Receptor-type tyrosine-protein phosphatase epsilon [Aphelenchoides besseyi]|nr:Receptor-type tyrosine-protein phosphatase epsilon [Aphelenchoides besseyi]
MRGASGRRRSRGVSVSTDHTQKNRTARKSTMGDDGTQMENTPKRRRPANTKRGRSAISVDKTADAGDPQVAMNAMLRQFVLETVRTGVDGLVKEFNDLKTITAALPSKTAFDANADKNRYKDVICGDNTRVVLNWPPGASDYLHANWVPVRGEKKFICTQGPIKKTIDDLWRLVWQEKCKAIVMLCGVMEQGKKKCEQYWPEKAGETMACSGITIRTVEVTEPEKILTVSKLELIVDGESFQCSHFLWNGWPDRGVPENFMACLRLLAKLKGLSPVVVHCSAGIGRTGTIVGLEMAQQTLASGERLKMFDLLKDLRAHRHGSVQTDVQYVYMHRVIIGLAENKKAVKREEITAFYDAYDAFIKERGATG